MRRAHGQENDQVLVLDRLPLLSILLEPLANAILWLAPRLRHVLPCRPHPPPLCSNLLIIPHHPHRLAREPRSLAHPAIRPRQPRRHAALDTERVPDGLTGRVVLPRRVDDAPSAVRRGIPVARALARLFEDPLVRAEAVSGVVSLRASRMGDGQHVGLDDGI